MSEDSKNDSAEQQASGSWSEVGKMENAKVYEFRPNDGPRKLDASTARQIVDLISQIMDLFIEVADTIKPEDISIQVTPNSASVSAWGEAGNAAWTPADMEAAEYGPTKEQIEKWSMQGEAEAAPIQETVGEDRHVNRFDVGTPDIEIPEEIQVQARAELKRLVAECKLKNIPLDSVMVPLARSPFPALLTDKEERNVDAHLQD